MSKRRINEIENNNQQSTKSAKRQKTDIKSEKNEIKIMINDESDNFNISQLKAIKYFCDKLNNDKSVNIIKIRDESLTMLSLKQLILFCNKNGNKNLCELNICIKNDNKEFILFLKTAIYFNVEITSSMIEEFYSSYPANPGISHKKLMFWYNSKIPILTQTVSKITNNSYILFNRPNALNTIEIIENFNNEKSNIYYDSNGNLKENIKINCIFNKLLFSFAHFYEYLVWPDFKLIIIALNKTISDFNNYSNKKIENKLNAKFETFIYCHCLFIFLSFIYKLKSFSKINNNHKQQIILYKNKLKEIIPLIIELINNYLNTKIAKKLSFNKYYKEFSIIIGHYFPKYKQFVNVNSNNNDNDNDDSFEKNDDIDLSKINEILQKQTTNDDNMINKNKSFGIILYKCILSELLLFDQEFEEIAINLMFKKHINIMFDDQEWIRSVIFKQINQKCALKISSILYHENIQRGQNIINFQPKYSDIISNFSGLIPFRFMFSD